MYLSEICSYAVFLGLDTTLIIGRLCCITAVPRNVMLCSDEGESTVEIDGVRAIIILRILINFQ
jgi:hypothetical protein